MAPMNPPSRRDRALDGWVHRDPGRRARSPPGSHARSQPAGRAQPLPGRWARLHRHGMTRCRQGGHPVRALQPPCGRSYQALSPQTRRHSIEAMGSCYGRTTEECRVPIPGSLFAVRARGVPARAMDQRQREEGHGANVLVTVGISACSGRGGPPRHPAAGRLGHALCRVGIVRGLASHQAGTGMASRCCRSYSSPGLASIFDAHRVMDLTHLYCCDVEIQDAFGD
jgi:hypothetical protein